MSATQESLTSRRSVSFDFVGNAPAVSTKCYAWARTGDLSIADIPKAKCKNKDVEFSLLRVVNTGPGEPIRGYHFNVRCEHPGGVLFGTYWLPRADVAWAEAGGLNVELYVGKRSVTINNLTDLGAEGDEE